MPCCGAFLNGVGTGFVDTFKNIGNAIAHPINTISTSIQNSADALKANPVGASLNQAIGSNPVLSSARDAVSIGSALLNGDNNAAGKIVGGQLAQAAIAVATEGVGKVLSSGAKGTVSLESRATEIHGAVSQATQSRTTIGVASATTSEGKAIRLVGSSENRLRPAQRAMLKNGEVEATGRGHAEVTILNFAQSNGMTIGGVAASRPICPSCATSIQGAGATAESVLKKVKTP